MKILKTGIERITAMKFLKLLDHVMSKIEEYALAWGIILMSVLLILNVLLRSIWGKSITFSEELGQILLTVVTFIGLSFVARHGKHIRMSVLYDYASPRLRKTLACVVSLVTGITLFWLSHIALNYMLLIKASRRITPALNIPVYLITCVVVWGFLSAAIQYAHIFYLNLTSRESYLGTYPGAEDNTF